MGAGLSAGLCLVALIRPETASCGCLGKYVADHSSVTGHAYRLAYRRDGGKVSYMSGPKAGVTSTVLLERGEYEFWATGLHRESQKTSVTRLSVSGSGGVEKLTLSF